MSRLYVNLDPAYVENEGRSSHDVACSVCRDLKYGLYAPWSSIVQAASNEKACQLCDLIRRGLLSFEVERERLSRDDALIQIDVSKISDRGDNDTKVDDQPTLRITTEHTFDTEEEASDPPTYEFFVRNGHESPCEAIRPCLDFSDSTLSTRWLDKATQWVRECVSTHPRCRGSSATSMPRRTLSIGKDIYLQDTENAKGIYACLSYCWGKDTAHQLRTTKANLQTMQTDGIKWSMIPKTVRHAIMIARQMHITYLWVDALCIIQDDEEDWMRESGNMASIYQNAFLTISAVSSVDTNHGIFCEADERSKQVHEVTFSTGKDPSSIVCIRRSLQHVRFRQMYQMNYDGVPLLGRAWAFQEHLLSVRTLQFTSSELLWECNQTQKCECGGVTCDGEQIKQTHSICLAENSRESLATVWGMIVQKYTSLKLTRPTDRLPAIAGVAHQVLELGTLGTYHAGLWRNDFVRELLWFHPESAVRKRPDVYRAPSWSWASVEGVSHFSLHLKQPIFPKVIDVQTETTSSDPTGTCIYGMCTIESVYLEAIITLHWEDEGKSGIANERPQPRYRLQCGLKDFWHFVPDVHLMGIHDSNTPEGPGQDVILLFIGQEPGVQMLLCFLVLGLVTRLDIPVYQRLGLTRIVEAIDRKHIDREKVRLDRFTII